MTRQAALQKALAGEHAAVYGYEVAGARMSGGQQRAALAARSAHLARRDLLAERLVTAGADPQDPAVGYALPFRIDDAAAAVRLVVVIEERLAAVYVDLVAASPGQLREQAALWVQEAAVRAHFWRGTTVAFPGLPERA